jgi:hypothetical protein
MSKDKPNYKAHCEGGPWHGKWIESDDPFIPVSHPKGGYQYDTKPLTVWLWRPVQEEQK